ncbi:protein HEXIM1 [Gastrophryne carolinensis]
MAEVGVQEPSLPCKTLAGGETLLGSQDESGWQPAMEEERGECPARDAPTLSCPDDEEDEDHNKPGDCPKPGHPGQGKEWKELSRKRHRRRPSKKKRPWKPYSKLTWEEKKRLEERESQRASRMRAEMFAKGQPVAPYNTTQFLMDDHNLEEPDLCPPQRRGPAALPSLNANSFNKGDSSEDDADEEEDGTGSDAMGSDDGSEFLQKDFSETYEKYHAESLQDMSKQELIREYLELEKCLSRMEEENNRLRLQQLPQDSRALETELGKLKEENQRLLLLLEQAAEAATPTGH